jgi:hypothetical protein
VKKFKRHGAWSMEQGILAPKFNILLSTNFDREILAKMLYLLLFEPHAQCKKYK